MLLTDKNARQRMHTIYHDRYPNSHGTLLDLDEMKTFRGYFSKAFGDVHGCNPAHSKDERKVAVKILCAFEGREVAQSTQTFVDAWYIVDQALRAHGKAFVYVRDVRAKPSSAGADAP
jgi:hypothetical protein